MKKKKKKGTQLQGRLILKFAHNRVADGLERVGSIDEVELEAFLEAEHGMVVLLEDGVALADERLVKVGRALLHQLALARDAHALVVLHGGRSASQLPTNRLILVHKEDGDAKNGAALNFFPPRSHITKKNTAIMQYRNWSRRSVLKYLRRRSIILSYSSFVHST